MSDHETLLKLAALQRDAVFADLAIERRKIAALETEIAEIARLQRKALAREGQDAARRTAGVDTAWQTWLGTRRAGLLQKLALARANEDGLATRAARAQGRSEAARFLAETEARDLRKRRLAAEERDRLSVGLQLWQRNRAT
ncbi:hypothetical protein [Litorisediminicola beolgyonensis]|uniref:Flagellar FliJ protein n=1 Tax=Litorisediminicola beolgyonensis TaxID=1173614 RepID=A0ABW3ZHI3_9RHOB